VEHPLVEFELTKEFRDRFQQALDEQDDSFIRKILEDVKPADITALLYEFNSEESKYVMDLLSIETQAEIISDLDPDTRKRFLKVYPPKEIINFLNQLASDDTRIS
jgi:magnesium transporter